MKKKIFTAVFSALACLALASCTGDGKQTTTETSTETTTAAPTTPKPTRTVTPDPVYNDGGVVFHYMRRDNDYSKFNAIWVWPKGGDGAQYSFDYADDYGMLCVVDMDLSDLSEVGFIVKYANDWTKDGDADRFVVLDSYEKDENDYYHVYLVGGDTKIYSTPDLKVTDDINSFSVTYSGGKYVLLFELSTAASNWTITKNGNAFLSSDTVTSDSNMTSKPGEVLTKFSYNLGTEMPDLKDVLTLTVNFPDDKTLSANAGMAAIYNTEAFADAYNYDGELGAIYTATKTTFRVWSPISTEMKLRVYNSGTPTSVNSTLGNDYYDEYTMTRGEKGTWEAEVPGDLDGKYYTYVVTNYKYTNKEIVDPYAKSCGVNGKRGMIVNFARINEELDWDDFDINEYAPESLTVYETHIADLTSSTTWSANPEDAQLQKTYQGFYKTGTTYTEDGVTVKTGFDHIKELGVNAVQIIPIFDSDNDEVNRTFNWGYNPLNYNALDGSYSTDPYDGYQRIREFKSLVKAYTESGVNIIMDVVYNHVMSADGSNFDVLMPYYYYRYNGSVLSNGSGCGNETASNMPMFRKFMVDSTEFWASEYKLGGFRFDLMGLHDLDTMAELSENLHDKVSEYVTVYGEPWAGGTPAYATSSLAYQSNIDKYTEYGCFNDKLRDALIKGGLNSKDTKGWITGTTVLSTDVKDITNGISGYVLAAPFFKVKKIRDAERFATQLPGGLYIKDGDNFVLLDDTATYDSTATYYVREASNDPYKCVNYVTCHDNYTLVDRIAAAGITNAEVTKKMAVLANSVVFTSQGITFMLAGEEFLRTKGGDSNSYSSSYEVNELDYSLKVKNADVFENYKKLIALKHNTKLFGLTTEADCEAVYKAVNFSSDNAMVSYKLQYTDGATTYEYYIVHCNGISGTHTVDLSGYTLYLDTLNTGAELTANYAVQNYQTIIAYRVVE